MIKRSKVMLIAVVCAIGTYTMIDYSLATSVNGQVVSKQIIQQQLNPIVCVDQPISGIQMGKKDFAVSGWSLNKSGVKEVKVYVNNTLIGNATINISRPDVGNIYSQYPGAGKSGYWLIVSKNKLIKGTNEIKVVSIGNDGVSTIKKVAVTVPNLANIVTIDTPRDGSTVSGDAVSIGGWALAQEGVDRVNILVNGVYVGSATYGLSRLDVAKVFPLYDGASNCGYNIKVPKSKFLGNTSTISVVVVSKDKTTARKDIKVNIKDNYRITTIDTPTANSTIENKNVLVGGWAINPSGVKTVTVSLNGKVLGNATMGPRPDIAKLYPNYTGVSKSAFNYLIDMKSFVAGVNSIVVEATGNDGTKSTKNINITYKLPPTRTALDYPYENCKLNNTDIPISGWALNPYGVKEVKIYVDGKYVKSATLGIARPDVDKVFPGYDGGATSGYRATLDKNTIMQGTHTITIEAIGNAGASEKITRTITLNKPNTYLVSDNFNGGSTYNKSFNIYGWALSPSGVKAVNVYVDGRLFNTTKPSLTRPDVNAALPGYPGGLNCGYYLPIDVNKIQAGTRKITLEVVGNDGMSVKKDYQLMVYKPAPVSTIDTPLTDQLVSSNGITVAGWALNATGISKVEIYLDNQLKANATIGLSRPDVAAAYASKNYTDASISGYYATIDSSNIVIGSHTVKIVATGKDGTTNVLERTVLCKGKVTYTDYSNSLGYYVDIQYAKRPPILSNSGTRTATRDEIYYEMNPNNFLNDPEAIYMFMKLNYTEGISAENLNKTLTTAGVLQGKGQAFLTGGKQYNVNPIYLVSHALLETGYGASQLSIGTTITEIADLDKPIYQNFLENGVNVSYIVGYEMIKLPKPVTVYNMYGIGAYDSNIHFSNRALITGLTRAYNEGWTSVDAAIIGGAKWIGSGYINNETFNQNTLYKMRWDFQYGWHQYATDILWARKQTYNISKLVNQMDNPVLEFDIPRFK